MIQRTTVSSIAEIIETYGKMAFLSGPRQVGKTTLAQEYQKRFTQSLYFNWDVVTDQKKLLKDPYFFEKENRPLEKPFLVVLDEIHKYARWKNYLKGAYDRYHQEFRFLVTGSGRLDLFKKGGDSLLGRYLSFPLFPFSVGEIAGRAPSLQDFIRALSELPSSTREAQEAYQTLFQFSGFPEPFIRSTRRFYNVWSQERKARLLREDIRDAATIREISLLEMLSHLLPERIGSPLSINALREDIAVAFETLRDWIQILERFFYLFRLPPFSNRLARSLKKETKPYLYDWAEVREEGARFENLIALHLWKAVSTWNARGEGLVALRYVRDKEKREVDFILTQDDNPICLVECKKADQDIAVPLVYFQRKIKVPVAVQLVHPTGICRRWKEGSFTRWIISADHWLGLLP